MEIKKLIKYGVENSSTPVSKAPQGSKKHKADVLQYIEKMKDMYEGPKISDQPILKNNINKKPHYPTQATPEAFGKLAERIERARQMRGEPKEMSTWEMLKKAADTPEEKKEIRQILREDYKKNGTKWMSEDDKKWIGKGTVSTDIKIDIEGNEIKIHYLKTDPEPSLEGYIYHGLSKKSFSLGYKIAPKFNIDLTEAKLENGLLNIFIPLVEEAKKKIVKIK